MLVQLRLMTVLYMLIDHRIWEAAQAILNEKRETKLSKLLSGNCTLDEYKQICGFLDGLVCYEQSLKEATQPRYGVDNGFDADGA